MIENPRVRLALAEHGRRLALALAVVGAALFVVAIWMVAAPSGETVTQQTDRQTIETELDTSAVVTNPHSPWEAGTRLENHPAYLLNATPTMNVTAETSAPDGTTVVHDLRLRTTVERDEGVVWEDTTPLATEEATVENGTATTTASINVSAYRQQVTERRAEFAGVGTVRSTLVLETRYDTGTYEGGLSASPSLSLTDRAYWVEGERTAGTEEFRTVTVQQDPQVDWSTVIVLVVVGGFAVVGAAGAATYRVEADLEAIRQELHRRRYDDWISDGSIPMGIGGEYVALDTLKDVVDVAIDTNQRVVYDRRRDVFAVITGEVVYYYSRDGDWNQVAWPTGGQQEEGPSFLEAFGMADEEGPTELDAEPPEEPPFADDDGSPFDGEEESVSDPFGETVTDDPTDDADEDERSYTAPEFDDDED